MRHLVLASLTTLAVSLGTTVVDSAHADTPKRRLEGLGLSSGRTPAPSAQVRRPLVLGVEEARLSGEIATRLVSVYVTASEAAKGGRIELAYLSAAAVLPEASSLSVAVNDRMLGERRLQATARPETIAFDIPAGLLEPGFNALRVSVRQRHRVDCSRDASFELWTQILGDQSALVLAGGQNEPRDLRDLAAVRSLRDGTTRLRLRVDSAVSDDLNRHARAMQAAVVLGRFAKPAIEVDPTASSDAGLDVLVATDLALMRDGGVRPEGTGPRVQLALDPATDRMTLTVTGRDLDEVEEALRGLEERANTLRAQGSAAGLRAVAARFGLEVQGGDRLSLAALGGETQSFAGRFYRQTIKLRLPSDFLAGDYDRVPLRIDGSYAPGGLATNKLSVRINGSIVGHYQLGKAQGDTLRKRLIYLPVRSFKPGVNTIELEADVLSATDEACETQASIAGPRLVLRDTTDLAMPAIARVATFPNLSGFMVGGLDRPTSGRGMSVYLPSARPEVVEASLGLIAKMASLRGKVTSASFTASPPLTGESHVIALGAVADLPDELLGAAGVDGARLRDAWRAQAPAPAPQAAAPLVRVASVGDGFTFRLADAATAGADLLTAPSAAESVVEASSGVAASAGAALQAARERLESLGEAALARLGDLRGEEAASEHPNLTYSAGSTLVIAQGAARVLDAAPTWRRPLPEVASHTVIVGPSAEMLRLSLADVLHSHRFEELVGGEAVYDRQDGSIRSADVRPQFVAQTAALSFGNAQLITAAWLSRHPGYFVGALASVVLLLTVLTACLVRATSGRGA